MPSLKMPLAVLLAIGTAAAQDPLHGAAPAAEQIAHLKELAVGRGGDHAVLAAFRGGPAPSQAQIELGQKLYFDTRLSADGTVSCATCHDTTRSFTDRRPVSEGIGGKLGRRNAPTTMNTALIAPLFWDGRSGTLAHQAGQPILNPIEMGMTSREQVVVKLKGIPEYQQAFQTAFGGPISYEGIERAIAAFEETLMFLDAPFDRFLAGSKDAISDEARKGFDLFMGKARCSACHPLTPANPLGTDYRFHNIGVSAHDKDFEGLARQALTALQKDSSETALDQIALATDMSELGRFVVTRNHADIGSFRTPQLRNIGITGPYMHDGSMQTLWDTIDHYNKGGETNSWLDGGIEALALEEAEIDQLVAFLFTLTDDRFKDLNERERSAQRERAQKTRPFRDLELAMRRKIGFEERIQK